jgi:hypothetical protein
MPKGKLGMQLSTIYEIKINGLMDLLTPIRGEVNYEKPKKKVYKWELHLHFLREDAQTKFRPVNSGEFIFDRVLPVPLAIQVAAKAEPSKYKAWLYLHHGTEDLIGKEATIEVADPTVLVITFTTQTTIYPARFIDSLSRHHPIWQIHLTINPPVGSKDLESTGIFSTSFYGLPHPVFEIEETIKMLIDEMGEEAIDEVQTLYADFICHCSLLRSLLCFELVERDAITSSRACGGCPTANR